ncbi:hypothetical protein Tco_0079273 [Tanacetum coccineum]
MNPIAAQQVALDNDLVAPENRVQIGKCNMRIDPTKTLKEPTYQVVLDSLILSPIYPALLIIAEVPDIYMHQFWHTITKIKNSSSYKFKLDKKKCTIDVEVFCDILQICLRLPNQEFDAPPSDEEIITFIKELWHKGDIKSVNEVVVDQMHQPWRTFATIINWCLSGKTSDFVFQIDNRDTKKQEKMYYPRFTKAIIYHFISKDKSISMRNKIFMHTIRDDSILGFLRFVSKSDEYQVYGVLLLEGITNQQMRDSLAYKTYLTFSIGAATSKKARKFRKPASPLKKKALVAIEEPTEKPVKKPAARRQSAGVQIRDSPGVSVSKKKAPAKAKRSKGIKLLSEAASLEEAQIRGVPDVSKADSSESEYKSWGDSDDDNDNDDQQSDDEQIKSDNDKSDDLNKTDDEEEDDFVHTSDDYVPTDDENVDDEEFKRINEEMYSDVNVELKDSKREGKEKDDEEMTDVGRVEVEPKNVNQEVAGDQVKDDAQATVTAAPAT